MTQTQRLDVRELINRNPLSRFQKLIIFLGFCVIALDGFDIAIMGFIAPTLKLEWGVSNHQLGLVISAALITRPSWWLLTPHSSFSVGAIKPMIAISKPSRAMTQKPRNIISF